MVREGAELHSPLFFGLLGEMFDGIFALKFRRNIAIAIQIRNFPIEY
jgi:hypothetical protein